MVNVSVGAGLWRLDLPLVLYRETGRERVMIVIRGCESRSSRIPHPSAKGGHLLPKGEGKFPSPSGRGWPAEGGRVRVTYQAPHNPLLLFLIMEYIVFTLINSPVRTATY
jgi:hypothetical protein